MDRKKIKATRRTATKGTNENKNAETENTPPPPPSAPSTCRRLRDRDNFPTYTTLPISVTLIMVRNARLERERRELLESNPEVNKDQEKEQINIRVPELPKPPLAPEVTEAQSLEEKEEKEQFILPQSPKSPPRDSPQSPPLSAFLEDQSINTGPMKFWHQCLESPTPKVGKRSSDDRPLIANDSMIPEHKQVGVNRTEDLIANDNMDPEDVGDEDDILSTETYTVVDPMFAFNAKDPANVVSNKEEAITSNIVDLIPDKQEVKDEKESEAAVPKTSQTPSENSTSVKPTENGLDSKKFAGSGLENQESVVSDIENPGEEREDVEETHDTQSGNTERDSSVSPVIKIKSYAQLFEPEDADILHLTAGDDDKKLGMYEEDDSICGSHTATDQEAENRGEDNFDEDETENRGDDNFDEDGSKLTVTETDHDSDWETQDDTSELPKPSEKEATKSEGKQDNKKSGTQDKEVNDSKSSKDAGSGKAKADNKDQQGRKSNPGKELTTTRKTFVPNRSERDRRNEDLPGRRRNSDPQHRAVSGRDKPNPRYRVKVHPIKPLLDKREQPDLKLTLYPRSKDIPPRNEQRSRDVHPRSDLRSRVRNDYTPPGRDVIRNQPHRPSVRHPSAERVPRSSAVLERERRERERREREEREREKRRERERLERERKELELQKKTREMERRKLAEIERKNQAEFEELKREKEKMRLEKEQIARQKQELIEADIRRKEKEKRLLKERLETERLKKEYERQALKLSYEDRERQRSVSRDVGFSDRKRISDSHSRYDDDYNEKRIKPSRQDSSRYSDKYESSSKYDTRDARDLEYRRSHEAARERERLPGHSSSRRDRERDIVDDRSHRDRRHYSPPRDGPASSRAREYESEDWDKPARHVRPKTPPPPNIGSSDRKHSIATINSSSGSILLLDAGRDSRSLRQPSVISTLPLLHHTISSSHLGQNVGYIDPVATNNEASAAWMRRTATLQQSLLSSQSASSIPSSSRDMWSDGRGIRGTDDERWARSSGGASSSSRSTYPQQSSGVMGNQDVSNSQYDTDRYPHMQGLRRF